MRTPEHVREYHATQPASEERLSRREAIKGMAGGVAAVASGLFFGGEQNEAQAANIAEATQLDESLQRKGYLVLPSSLEREGKGILAPSVIEPEFRHGKVIISKNLASTTGTPRARVWLPTPIDLGAARNVAIQPMVYADGKVVDPDSYDTKLIHTKPNRLNPHVNSMTEFDFKRRGIRGRNLTFLTVNDMVLPHYDTVTALKSTMIQAANTLSQQRRMPLQQAQATVQTHMQRLCQEYGYRDLTEFSAAASVVTTDEFAKVKSILLNALAVGNGMNYSAADNDIRPGCGRDNTGDCGTIAVESARASRGTLVMSVGFNRVPDAAFTGQHAINLGSVPTADKNHETKVFSADARKNNRIEFYPASATHLGTEVGNYFEYDSNNFPSSMQGYMTHNNGVYWGNGLSKESGRVHMTSSSGGLDNDISALYRQLAAQESDADVAAKAKLQMETMRAQY